jgi:lipopolysaccharide/colanic/teichoic acid biosynthesis glycosyltransferase
MTITTTLAKSATWHRLKRVGDVSAALLIGLVALPAIALACLAVKLTSRGPAIYSQQRIGWKNRHFTIYKIRTMTVDAEKAGGPRWCVPGDPRVTPLGRVLRALHVDELPQLWNVLRGEMSLIGPRPERPEFMPKIKPFVPGYDLRHAVRPGITGLAQVQVGADTEVSNVARKLRYDLYYIEHAGPALEARILVATLLKVIGVNLATLRQWMGLNLEQPAELRRAA